MIVELLRGVVIAVSFFGLGALWATRRRSRIPLVTVSVSRGLIEGVAQESFETGQALCVDLTPHFPRGGVPVRPMRVAADEGGCWFCRGFGVPASEYLSHDDDHCPRRSGFERENEA